jgi:Lrp/AsnC family leucine-responsive transcriptional regulator
MDSVDRKILSILANDAGKTATEIGRVVNLSIPAVNKRIAKLKEEGVILSTTVITDAKKVGKPVCAFILLVMRYGEEIGQFMKHIKEDPDILECYAITGEYDYLIKVCAPDVQTLEEKLLFIKGQKGVTKSHTMLALAEHKFEATVL